MEQFINIQRLLRKASQRDVTNKKEYKETGSNFHKFQKHGHGLTSLNF